MKRFLWIVGLTVVIAGVAVAQHDCPGCPRAAAERSRGNEEPAAPALSSEWQDPAGADPGVKLLPEWTVASITGTGDEAAAVSSLYRVIRWMSAQALPMVGRPFVVWYDEPGQVVPESLRYMVGVPIPDRVGGAAEEGIVVKPWGGFRVAAAGHVGPRDRLDAVRVRIREWTEAGGWEIAGSAAEFFFDLPGQVPDDSLRVEVAYPVREAGSR